MRLLTQSPSTPGCCWCMARSEASRWSAGGGCSWWQLPHHGSEGSVMQCGAAQAVPPMHTISAPTQPLQGVRVAACCVPAAGKLLRHRHARLSPFRLTAWRATTWAASWLRTLASWVSSSSSLSRPVWTTTLPPVGQKPGDEPCGRQRQADHQVAPAQHCILFSNLSTTELTAVLPRAQHRQCNEQLGT